MVDSLEERLFEQFDEKLIHEIFKAKRAAFSFRRHVGPLREVAEHPHQPPLYLHSAPTPSSTIATSYDHTIRIMESLDTVRDLLAGVLETYLFADVESDEQGDEAAVDRRPRSRCRSSSSEACTG